MRVVHALKACDWPGNVRELANGMERAVITSRAETLALPEDSVARSAAPSQASDAALVTLEELESNYIRQVLEHTRGRISGEAGAARVLGMNPNTLRSRMSKLGITRVEEVKYVECGTERRRAV